MFGSKFSPRLESLDSRLCPSATGAEVTAVDVFRPGEEVAAVDMFRTGEVRGAAVDGLLVNNEKGESGWDVKPGEEAGLLPAVRVESGWDVKPGEEQGAVDMFRTGGERGAAVDYSFPTDQIGGPYIGEAGWDKQP